MSFFINPKATFLIKRRRAQTKLHLAFLTLVSILILSACNSDSPENYQAPLANNDAISVDAGAINFIDVINNDTKSSNRQLTITSVGAAQHGEVRIENNQIRYESIHTFKGVDSFTYTVSDGREQSSATVNVDVLLDQIDVSTKTRFAGDVGAPVASEHYLYVPHGSIITVVDLSNQNQEKSVSLPILTPTKTEIRVNPVAQVKALEIVGEYLYAALDSGKVAVLSLTKPNMPELIGEFDFLSSSAPFISPKGLLKVSDTRVYLFDRENGIVIVDTSNPALPVLKSILSDRVLADNFKRFGNLLISNGVNGIGGQIVYFVNISDPDNPSVINTFYENSMRVSYNDHFMLVRKISGDRELFNISNPAQITAIDLPNLADGEFAFHGDLLYVFSSHTLNVYDFSDTAQLVTSLDFIEPITREVREVTSPMGWIHIGTDHRITLVGKVEQTLEVLKSQFVLSTSRFIDDLAFTEQGIIAAHPDFGFTTHVYDNFKQLSRVDFARPAISSPGAREFELDGVENILYTSDFKTLMLFDVSDISKPIELGQLELGAVNQIALDPSSKKLLAGSRFGYSLSLVDVSNKQAPILLNTLEFDEIKDIHFHNGRFYVLGTNTNSPIEGLHVFNFVAPTGLNLEGVYPCNADPQQMSFQDNLAVLRCDRQIHVLDISNVSAPVAKGFYQNALSSNFGASAIKGNRLFLASLFEIEELNIANPSRPRLIQNIEQFGCDVKLHITEDGDLYCMGYQSQLMFKSQ